MGVCVCERKDTEERVFIGIEIGIVGGFSTLEVITEESYSLCILSPFLFTFIIIIIIIIYKNLYNLNNIIMSYMFGKEQEATCHGHTS